MATTNATTFSKEQINTVYTAMKERLMNPEGSFDKQGRWYPSAEQRCCSDNCPGTLRAPTKAYPYSWMLHCRTRKHCAYLAASQPEYFATLLAQAEKLI
jgi:hypothetical protein